MNYGDTPYVVRGQQTDYRRLLYNEFDHVLSIPITCQAGYGTLKQGTAMSENLSAAGNDGRYLPYCPTTFTGGEAYDPGRAYLVADVGSGETEAQVTMDDSYKFAVGDDLIGNSSGQGSENLGAITAIDRTTYTNRAVITFTSASTEGFATANVGHVLVEAGTAANNYSDCVGILATAVETGTGENAKGGQGVLILSNAVMYTGMIWNLDSAAQTDISSTARGKYTYLK